MSQGRQYIWDETNQQAQEVNWPGVTPLSEDHGHGAVMQLQFWSPVVNQWVFIVRQKTGRNLPGTLELSIDDALEISKVWRAGRPPMEVLSAVKHKGGPVGPAHA